MKILIFSMTCGEGHNSIAKSLKKEFENSLGSDVECEILQTYGFDEGRIEKENQRFLKTCKTIPHLYDMVWNMTRKRNFSKPSKIFHNEIKYQNVSKIKSIKIVYSQRHLASIPFIANPCIIHTYVYVCVFR